MYPPGKGRTSYTLPRSLNETEDELLSCTEFSQNGKTSRSVLPSFRLPVIFFFCGVLVTSISFLCYGRSQCDGEVGQGLSNNILKFPGDTVVNFRHNEAFTQAPSRTTEEIWRTILPNGLGFVQHPDIGPEIVGLAFVHQLHCLKKLHDGFYASYNRNETNEMTQHVQHCLEYLRLSIMCDADTNLETRTQDEVTGIVSVTGYGDHQCRDYDKLFVFAERYRIWNGKSEAEKHEIGEDENIPGRNIHYDYLSSRGDIVPED